MAYSQIILSNRNVFHYYWEFVYFHVFNKLQQCRYDRIANFTQFRIIFRFGRRLDRDEKYRFPGLIFISVLKAKFGAACNNHKEIEDNSGDDLQKFLNDFSRQASEMEGMVISVISYHMQPADDQLSLNASKNPFQIYQNLYVQYDIRYIIHHMIYEISRNDLY